MTINYRRIGEKIKQLRLAQGLSQEELAEYCGLSTSYISYIETGKRRISLKKLETMSKYLHFNVCILAQDDNNSLLYLLKNCTDTEKEFLYQLLNAINKELGD